MFIYLGFCWTTNKDSPLKEKIKVKLIQWYTKSKYYHVILGIGSNYITSEPSSGVVCRSIKNLKNISNYEFYRIKLSPILLTKQQLVIFRNFVENQVGKKYDWLGIVGRVFTILRDNSNRWFCSEIVAKLLQMLYVEEMLYYEPSEITPAKLFRLLKHRLEKMPINAILH